MKELIMKKAKLIQDELVNIRRTIHQYPEFGMELYKTADLVSKKLNEMGVEVQTGVGKTGVVGLLKGKQPGKTILLRGDMDCLEMEEVKESPYKSKHQGLMHSCGHDAHASWLLGAAMILSEMRDEFNGTVKFLFQPGEEIFAGAKAMIEDGVLLNPKVDAAIAGHIVPELPSGMMGVGKGVMLASIAYIKLKIIGKGGGSGSPHLSVDPISVANQVYNGLQHIITRKVNPSDNVVLSICKFNAGSAFNVIPEEVVLEGSIRTPSIKLAEELPVLVEQCIKGICDSSKATYELVYDIVVPPIIIDSNVNEVVRSSGNKMLGTQNVITIEQSGMGGEDFALISKEVPSSYFAIGTYNEEKGITAAAHNPHFDIDEDVLSQTSAVLAQIAIDYLNE